MKKIQSVRGTVDLFSEEKNTELEEELEQKKKDSQKKDEKIGSLEEQVKKLVQMAENQNEERNKE